MTEHVDKKDRGFPLKKIREFCALHPNDPVFRLQLAERYFELGHDIRAIYAARKAHALFLQEKSREAHFLVKRHGVEVDSRDTEYLGGGDFLPLAEHFNFVTSPLHKVSLKEDEFLYRKGDTADYYYLVLEGELTAVHDKEGRHSLLSHFRKGDIFGEHEPKEVVEEEDDDDNGEAIKTMYRGNAILEDSKSDQLPKKKKEIMYRGSVINTEKNTNSSKPSEVTYRGQDVPNSTHQACVRNVSVLAEKNSNLLKFTRAELEKAWKKHPKLEERFKQEQLIHQCLANISLSKLFTCLPADLRFMIARRSKTISHEHDKSLNTKGTFIEHAHLIVSGHIHMHEVQADDENDTHYCGRLGLGDVLGLERALKQKPPVIIYKSHYCKTIQIDLIVLLDIMSLSKQFHSLISQYARQRSTKTSRIMRLWSEGID